MKYFKVKNGIVIQVICNPRKGFTETNENVVPGMLFDSGVFTTPEPEPKSIQRQIVDLENSITERNKREYVKGLKYPTDERFFYSVKKIDKIDADIELLRAEAKAQIAE